MKFLREIIGLCLLPVYRLTRKRDHRILSVYFHKPTPRLFRTIVADIVKRGYTVISTGELAERIRNKDLPRSKTAIITFDDGSIETLELLPIIEEFNIPVTMFIPAEPVQSGYFWWNLAGEKNQFQHSGLKTVGAFKTLPVAEFDNKIDTLKSFFRIPRTCINKEELLRLSAHTLITIGSHTVTHPILKNCPPQRQEFELVHSRALLEEWTGKSVLHFAYPNGDFNRDTAEIVRRAGYELAFSTRQDRIDILRDDPYFLPRYSINDDGGIYENLAKSLGIWQRIFSGS